jgi:hypothetical protein
MAHGPGPMPPDALWRAWSFDLLVLGLLLVACWGYGRGVRRLWVRAGLWRGIRRWHVLLFVLGQTVVVIALVSPLDRLGGTLLSAHMMQHGLLVTAAPLLSSSSASREWHLPGRSRRVGAGEPSWPSRGGPSRRQGGGCRVLYRRRRCTEWRCGSGTPRPVRRGGGAGMTSYASSGSHGTGSEVSARSASARVSQAAWRAGSRTRAVNPAGTSGRSVEKRKSRSLVSVQNVVLPTLTQLESLSVRRNERAKDVNENNNDNNCDADATDGTQQFDRLIAPG